MSAWPHEEPRLSSRREETRLGTAFVAALVIFIAVLVGVGSILRFMW